MSRKVRRLFEQFQPDNYQIKLSPDRDKMVFYGSVKIRGKKTGRPSQRITLHQKNLIITKASLTKHDKNGNKKVLVSRINCHKALDEVRLHTKDLLYPGSYTISLAFEGIITRQMNGVYPCFFKYGGQAKKLIATQFESHHAREVFPSIDEPEAKATFNLTLTTPIGEQVVSNTPLKAQNTKGKHLVSTFETTPVMSTYLLAFVYGEVGYQESKTKHGVVVRVYATPDNVRLTNFAVETAVKCLEFFEDYFGIKYPLAKCDLIALPDFGAGAMENWGCITFREQALLVDEKNSSLANKQSVAMVIAHELAHQWFGNLVTMRWWTDLWLNEGFASWIEYLAVDKLFPKWEMWTQFIVDEQQQALKLDALEHTHPVEVPIYHPDEIHSIFDAISYSKGSSVIHMLYHYLGKEAFRGGLSFYLKKHAYKNTDTIDLWMALEEVSGKPVKDFMHAWTSQPGFPLVEAEVNNESIKLTQKRFFINPKHHSDSDLEWPVPLLAKASALPDILDQKNTQYQLPIKDDFKVNFLQSGFYRVSYNASYLELLGHRIKTGHLGARDRLGLLNDVFESAKAGDYDTSQALHFLGYFGNEDNYAVWDVIASITGSIKLAMGDEDLRELMKPYIRKLVHTQLKRLGWERNKNESHFDRLLRPIILSLSASADEEAVVKRCFDIFSKIAHAEEVAPDLQVAPFSKSIKRGTDLDPDLRGTVFGTVARLGDKKDFEKLLKLHDTALLSEERVTLSAALTGFKQPELIKRALGLIASDTVRLQDVTYWLVYSFINRHAKHQTWEWLKVHWKWLNENIGTELSFYRIPIYVAISFSDEAFLKDYKEFFTSVMSPALERSYKQGIEIIQWQSAWKQRDLKEIKTFFKSQPKNS